MAGIEEGSGCAGHALGRRRKGGMRTAAVGENPQRKRMIQAQMCGTVALIFGAGTICRPILLLLYVRGTARGAALQ